jgi:hypothetical protein
MGDDVARAALDGADRAKAIRATKDLGERGGHDDLEPLLARARRRDGTPGVDGVADRAHFAAVLIGHRLGLPNTPELVKTPTLGAPRKPETIRFERAPAGDFPQIAAHAARMAGVMNSREHAYLLRCGGSTLGVLLDPDVVADRVVRLQRPAVLGVVTRLLQGSHAFGLYLVVLTRPTPRGLDLFVHQDSGRPRYAGTARFEGDVLHFSLSTVEAPGAAAVNLTGAVDSSGLRLDTATTSTTVDVPKRVPALESR